LKETLRIKILAEPFTHDVFSSRCTARLMFFLENKASHCTRCAMHFTPRHVRFCRRLPVQFLARSVLSLADLSLSSTHNKANWDFSFGERKLFSIIIKSW